MWTWMIGCGYGIEVARGYGMGVARGSGPDEPRRPSVWRDGGCTRSAYVDLTRRIPWVTESGTCTHFLPHPHANFCLGTTSTASNFRATRIPRAIHDYQYARR